MRRILLLAMAIFCMVVTGCVQVPLSYQPTMKNVETLKASNMASANVGKFAVSPEKQAAIDQSVSARAATIVSPNNNSFALFLKEAVTQELRSAGKYDQNSMIVISGLLTKNSLEAPIGTGKGTLGAKFAVARDGNPVFEKELEESAEWPSVFMGVEAIPTAINEYTSLYKKLLGRLFGDADFRKATQAK
jgi:hypothetical protein